MKALKALNYMFRSPDLGIRVTQVHNLALPLILVTLHKEFNPSKPVFSKMWITMQNGETPIHAKYS